MMKSDHAALLQNAFVTLLETHERVHRQTAQHFKGWKLTASQYNVLRILRGAGPEGRPSQRIADDMISKVPDITRLVGRMQHAGLVSRVRDEHDGRIVRVVITAKGLKLLAELDEPVRRLHAEALQGFTRPELETLIALAKRVGR